MEQMHINFTHFKRQAEEFNWDRAFFTTDFHQKPLN